MNFTTILTILISLTNMKYKKLLALALSAMLLTACGSTMLRKVCLWVRPSERPASVCPLSILSMPLRSISQTYAEVFIANVMMATNTPLAFKGANTT